MYPKVGQYARVAESFRVHGPVWATASAAVNRTSATARTIGILITLNLHAGFAGMVEAFALQS
jgi:hypothetical protein